MRQNHLIHHLRKAIVVFRRRLSPRAVAAAMVVVATAFVAASAPVAAQDLGSARLQIAGTRLVLPTEPQSVPLDTPTLLETRLEGFDAALGALPEDIRVVGELRGPGLSESLRLETFPNEPFRIPALSATGEHLVEDVRLMQGEELLAYAEPRIATVQVVKLLISQVRTRALTDDEIRSHGLVVEDGSRDSIHLSFAYGFDNHVLHFGMPLEINAYGPGRMHGVPENAGVSFIDQDRTVRVSGRFAPPSFVPFRVMIEKEEREKIPTGGCPITEICRNFHLPEPPIVGVILFPTELSLLNQFFSVVLVVQNGALEGSGLTVEDLQARIKLPSGLRQAETDPPTPLGVPVPVRVPGADGELGTSDDLTVIVAQASAEAGFQVEGLREGNHVVEFDMQGTLRGMPGGPRQISGKARGAVVVRDPTLSMTSSHPRVVRANTPYTTRFTVTNLGNQPINDLEVSLPTSGLSNVRLADDEVATKPAGSLLPGESSMVEFRVIPSISGKLHSTSARGDLGATPRFDITMGVSDGIPLSPEVLALPEVVETLPAELATSAITLLGVAHSLSKAPYALVRDKPQVTGQDVSERAYRLVEAGKHRELGEGLVEVLSVLTTEWAGGRDRSWEWDRLRRSHFLGLELAEITAAALSAEVSDPRLLLERMAATTHFLDPWYALAEGAELELESRVSGKVSRAFLAEAMRELPFSELLPLAGGELGILAEPEPEGVRIRIARDDSGGADLTVVLPGADRGPMRLVSWSGVSLAATAVAWVDVEAGAAGFDLQVDDDGDGTVDRAIPGSESVLAPRPFEAVTVRQNSRLDPTGHMVHVLFSEDVDLASLLPADPDRFRIPGNVSNGGMTVEEVSLGTSILGVPGFVNRFEGMMNPRIVQVIFDNPLGPFEGDHLLTVDGLRSSCGSEITAQTLPVDVTVHDRAIQLEGVVRGPNGEPVPFAELRLIEKVFTIQQGDASCTDVRTAAAWADAEGRFHFPYVRQGECGDVFRVRAKMPGEPFFGESTGRVRFFGETQTLDVVMRGRGTIEGKIRYDDGSIPQGVEVVAENMAQDEGRRASVDSEGNYRVEKLEVGTITISAWDELGNQLFQTVELPTAGAEVTQDLTLIRRPDEPDPGSVRGTVVNAATGEPENEAWVAVYVDGSRAGVETTGADGTFDFGVVRSGQVEIVAFDHATREQGAQLFFELSPDEVETVELRLLDEQGVIEGHVYHVDLQGNSTPMEGADVWISQLSHHAVTDANGYFRLEAVPIGTRQVNAADAERTKVVSTSATLDSANTTRSVNLYMEDELRTDRGTITGVVYGQDGLPVKSANVHLSQGYGSARWSYDVQTDAAGGFRMERVQPGTYGVHAIKGKEGAISWAEIRFPGDADHVEIHFWSGTIRGRTFYVDPVSGEEIAVVSRVYYHRTRVITEWDLVGIDRGWQSLTTESDGTFEIDALYGPYALVAENAFHGRVQMSGFLDIFTQENLLEFQPNGAISGRVLLSDGETPVAGAQVSLHGGQFGSYVVHSDESGEFFFDLVPKGGYHIRVRSDDGMIYRETRVGVRVREAGDHVDDVDILLPRQGTVVGWVEEPDGAPVAGATVRLGTLDHHGNEQIVTADDEGRYAFYNVFEGRLIIRATSPELGGGGGYGHFELSDEGEEVQTVVTVDGRGDIAGRVLSPVDGQPVAYAEVQLGSSFRLFDSTQTDEDGEYAFRRLPVGRYQVTIFDPTTGRRGRSEQLEVMEHGDLVEVETFLEARGRVEGHVYDPPENTGVIGETVQLRSQGLKWFHVYSTTDTAGHYYFDGIPEGDFILFNRTSSRRARAEGRIEFEDQVVVRDLYLEELKAVRAFVYGPKGADGLPGPLMENVTATVEQAGVVVGSGTDNPLFVDGLLPRSAGVRVWESGGRHLVTDRVDLSKIDGAVAELELVMRAMGQAEVRVVDSLGQPVPHAKVTMGNLYSTLNGTPPEAGGIRETFHADADADGVVTFGDLREGRLNVSATDPISDLGGRSHGLLTYEGETVLLTVSLQPSGQVQGQVLLSDGLTPAVRATVSMRRPGSGWQMTESDAEGRFAFTRLPLGSYELFFQELDGPGSHRAVGELATDQQVDDHLIVLDDEDPKVESIVPAVMEEDVAVSASVAIRFSEPIENCGSCGAGFRFRDMSTGGYVPYVLAWSEDHTLATLVPEQPLKSDTMYRVEAKAELRDRSGRRLSPELVSGFTTADIEPPKVIDLRPAPAVKQVPLDTSVRIQFSEPVDTHSLSGAFRLRDVTTGTDLTLTTQVRLSDRGVTLTAVEELQADRKYELRITGVADPVGNVMPEFTSVFWTVDQTAPAITWQAPVAHRSFVAGDSIEVVVDATDRWIVSEVRMALGEWSSPVHAAPTDGTSTYRWTVPAPVMETAGEVEIRATASDEHGNVVDATRTIWVEPLDNAVPPGLEVGCPVDGDLVAPGVPVDVSFRVSDDLAVESAWYLVDGEEIERRTPVDLAESAITFTWTPPAAAAGTSFAVELATRDFAGNVTRSPLVLSVPTGTLVYEGDDLATATGDVYLARGRHDLAVDLEISSLTLLSGARLVAAPGSLLQAQEEIRQQCGSTAELASADAASLIVESGAVTRPLLRETLRITADQAIIQPGASLDASGRGYPSRDSGHEPPYAPEGIDPAWEVGASHGGVGGASSTRTPQPAYDSVYVPHMAGAGGGDRNSNPGGTGGGVIDLRVGSLHLDGMIEARGNDASDDGGSNGGGGAGGSILVDAATLSGTGSIDVGGGDSYHCIGGGGGGRIALYVGSFQGFEPELQAFGRGGAEICTDETWGGAGTVYVETTAEPDGVLRIDNRSDRADSGLGRSSHLPALGNGTLQATQVEGEDLWIFASTAWSPSWLGAWIRLDDGAGSVVGTFRVAEIDGTAMRLRDADHAHGAVGYAGLYRFGRLEVERTALATSDGLEFSGAVSLGGEVDLPTELRAGSVEVAADARLRLAAGMDVTGDVVVRGGARIGPLSGDRLSLRVGGTLTLETGAEVDVSSFGYTAGEAPDGLVGAGPGVGGSHGGEGGRDGTDEAGEVYDSVYRPRLAGGGGANADGYGGGVLTVEAGEVVLDGAFRATGREIGGTTPSGAGGTVRVETARLSGGGEIDASGGLGLGGGGRVALWAGELAGFDPSSQVRVWGGQIYYEYDGVAEPMPYAPAGTLFVHTAASTHGDLFVDNGRLDDGSLRRTWDTELPTLGGGTVESAVAVGSDLEIDLGTVVRVRWDGAFAELTDASGSVVGVYRVAEIGPTTLRLAGAATHEATAAGYRGVYRFDRLRVASAAGFAFDESILADRVELDGEPSLEGPLHGGDVVLGAGALVRPVGYGALVWRADREIVIPSDATVSVRGRSEYVADLAPPNVVPSTESAASHGGLGTYSNGEIYGSVYAPRYAGGRPSGVDWTNGGGQIFLRADVLRLDGILDAEGGEPPSNDDRGGAGGTVTVDARQLVGSGRITAAGTDQWHTSGGGGRVALYVDDLSLFDPIAQVDVSGGWAGSKDMGGPGTLFVFDQASTWGSLVMDNEVDPTVDDFDDTPALLPTTGTGTIGVVTPDAGDPSHLWVEPQDPAVLFDLGVEGMWLRVHDGVAETEYRILAEDGSRRRILLENAAATVAAGHTYRGVYRFDRVTLRNKIRLKLDDVAEVGTWDVDATSLVEAPNFALAVAVTSTGSATEGSAFLLEGTFEDQELGQTHVATVDWGDGSPVESATLVDTDPGSFSASHVWTDDGVYAVEVCVEDADGDGRGACAQAEIGVENVAPVLTLGGMETYDGWVLEEAPVTDIISATPTWSVGTAESGEPQVWSVSAKPSFFYDPEATSGRHWHGMLQTRYDKHYVGVAIGFEPGEAATPDGETDFLLLAWARSSWQGATPGLRLYRVRGASDFWTFGEATTELVAEAASLAHTPHSSTVSYDVEVQRSERRLRIWIDGAEEFDVRGELPAGHFGYFTHYGDVYFRGFGSAGGVADEGVPLVLSASLADAGVLDVHTATVDWGDGSAVEAASVSSASGAGTITTSPHVYAQDGAYTATICVEDGVHQTCGSVPVTVHNDLPVLSTPELRVQTGDGASQQLATFTELGALDVHSATIDWGDGTAAAAATVEVVDTAASPATWRVTSPVSLPVGSHAAEVCVTDDAPETVCAPLSIVVEGMSAPTVASPADSILDEGETWTLSTTFSDADAGDVHAATVDWGDGSPVADAVVDAAAGTVEASHAYAEDGSYAVQVCVSDLAGMSACAGATAAVANVAPTPRPLELGLERWTSEEDETDGYSPPEWTVSADGVDVAQPVASRPAHLRSDWQAKGHRIRGSIYGDGGAHVLGFGIGVEADDLGGNPTTDYVLFNWKRNSQGMSPGLRVYRITSSDTSLADPWTLAENEYVELLQSATTLGSTAWEAYRLYAAEIEIFGDSVRLWIDGNLELDVAVPVAAGSLTFYNAWQPSRFEGFVRESRIVREGGTLDVDVRFTDPGSQDTFSGGTVDWGDGSAVEAITDLVAGTGEGRLRASHLYATPGQYTATVCVSDDEAAEGCSTFPVRVDAEADYTPPTATVSGVASSYHAGQTLAATIDTSDNVGASEVRVTFDGTTTTLTNADFSQTFQYSTQVDPALTTARSTTFEAVAVDQAGNESDPVTQAVDLLPDDPAALAVGVLPGLEVDAGTTLDVTADVSDDVRIETIRFELSGAWADAGERTIGAATASELWQPTLPSDLAPGSLMTLAVEATDSFGHVTRHESEIRINGDAIGPEVAITLDPVRSGDVYSGGEVVTVTATATDNMGVDTFSLTVDGETVSGASPLSLSWTAPPTISTATHAVHAEAVDVDGNVGTADRTLTVEAHVNAVAPEVAFACPTNGAIFPSAYDLTLRATAVDDEGIAEIELYRGSETTPIATVTPGQGTAPSLDLSELVTLPTLSGGPQTVSYRVVAYDAALNSSEDIVTFDVVETVDLDAAGANDWLALASATAVLRTGTLELSQPRTLGGLIVLDGASLTHPASAPGAETALDLTVNGPVYVACGGAIDVSGRGYGASQTHPGEVLPGPGSGGSHMGLGGKHKSYEQSSSFGSLYRPREPGGGGESTTSGKGQPGGGVVYVSATSVVVDGAIRANGLGLAGNYTRGGAGGSIWIDSAGGVDGSGVVEAQGGAAQYYDLGSGGGGAIAVYYGSLGATLESGLLARGGADEVAGGAGTVYLQASTAAHGDLLVDAGAVVGGITDLPALGAGTAEAGSSATRLETSLSSIQPYFAGHWVEIYDGATGALEGTWRVDAVDGTALVLTAGATVDAGDLWQGVYRFDDVVLRGDVDLRSDDPIRSAGMQEIDGTVEAERITGHDLVLRAGSVLTHPATTDPADPRRLEIDLDGQLLIEAGAVIDVSGRGYGASQTYPGEVLPGPGSGGSHMGLGGKHKSYEQSSSFGSLYRPREPGGGGESTTSGKGQPGGGVVYVSATSVVVDGAIRANGLGLAGNYTRGGAGGSIWIDSAGGVDGSGVVEAQGGAAQYYDLGSGGGGAIAVYYGSLGATLESGLLARGGADEVAGGAGTVFLFGPGSAHGVLIVDNGMVVGASTDLPSLGSGLALSGSAGDLLVTDRATAIPEYFLGHGVEISSSTGVVKGTYPILEIFDGTSVRLGDDDGALPSVAEGDQWRGVYRFDTVTVENGATLTSGDAVFESGTEITP